MGIRGMGDRFVRAVSSLVLLAIATSCGGGGGSGNIRGGGLPKGPLPSTLTVITHWPEAESIRAPLTTAVAIQFDSPLHAASITDGQTFLEVRDTGARIKATISLSNGNQSIVVKPVQPLLAETWYTCHLSALLCDLDERLLEEDHFFSFRTVDVTAPGLVSSSVPNGAKGVLKDVLLGLDFDGSLDPLSITTNTVRLLDANDREHAVTPLAVGKSLQVKLIRDLLPLTRYTLHVNGVKDVAGNPLATAIETSFTTRDDSGPRILKVEPTTELASPNAHVFLHFDSSLDVTSASQGTIQFVDDNGSDVAFVVHADPSQRILRLVPRNALRSGETYSVSVKGAIKNPGGKTLTNIANESFTVGTDATPPKLMKSVPADESNRVSFQAIPTFDFDEQLEPSRLNNNTIEFSGENGPLPFVVTTGANSARIFITPSQPLSTGHKYTVTLRSGPLGVCDLAGNFLGADLKTVFYTSTDRTPPTMTISPTNGHSAVSKYSTYTAAFDESLDPASVNTTAVIVTDESNMVVDGTATLSANRIITFEPDDPYTPGEWYIVTLRSGVDGIRESSGNWLQKPVRTTFRIAHSIDTTPPDVTVTVNGIAKRRKAGLSVPKSGFELTVLADDPVNYDVDLGSFDVEITGSGVTLDSDAILAGGTITKQGLSFVVALSQAFKPGEYTFRARVADMAGNVGVSEPLVFQVVDSDSGVLPFERTQVVWVRFDLDRVGNGRPDSIDDLYRLGLLSEGDPSGTNQRMIDIMRDGILAQTHTIFQRKRNGGRKSQGGSMPVIFTAIQPRGVQYSELAFGGLDPSAPAGRKYSDKSSGILGRAYYDKYNSSRADKNTGTRPGLGVFGGELFLFEVETHLSLYPYFLTTFANRFQKVIPQMGGTPAGTHSLDKTVLARDFDLANASPSEMRRYFDVFLAVDDWASATSVILAHETGHTVGLVSSGAPPMGLHGDRSLHNSYPSLGDVMSSSVGYESLVNLTYRFRDLNAAYLSQRILLK